ncbi:hypothetical protein ZWY2020_001574 [Hordeum vulgare]|nr:hypothetical protein ZWY2020_001574 [Hordeum vulgare]
MLSSDSGSDGATPGGVWSSGLTVGQTEDLIRFCLYMPLAANMPRPWRISVDGFATLDPSVTNEELCDHAGSRYNRKGRRRFWHGKSFNEVVGGVPTQPGVSPSETSRGWALAHPAVVAGPSRRRAVGPIAMPALLAPVEVPVPLE